MGLKDGEELEKKKRRERGGNFQKILLPGSHFPFKVDAIQIEKRDYFLSGLFEYFRENERR